MGCAKGNLWGALEIGNRRDSLFTPHSTANVIGRLFVPSRYNALNSAADPKTGGNIDLA
jgi:hypothetical protein